MNTKLLQRLIVLVGLAIVVTFLLPQYAQKIELGVAILLVGVFTYDILSDVVQWLLYRLKNYRHTENDSVSYQIDTLHDFTDDAHQETLRLLNGIAGQNRAILELLMKESPLTDGAKSQNKTLDLLNKISLILDNYKVVVPVETPKVTPVATPAEPPKS